MKTITLPSGKTAEIIDFKGKHIMEAQRIAGSNLDKMIFAMIAVTTKINGAPVILEDLEEMDGTDVMTLMGEFGGNLSPANS